MKKIRILAVVLAVSLVAGLFSGCFKKLTTEQVSEDPQYYIAEGAEISLRKTPFSAALDEDGTHFYEIAVSGKNDKLLLKTYSDADNNKAAVELSVKYMAEGASPIEEEGTFYIDGKEYVLQSELLKTYFGTGAVGLDLGAAEEKLSESPLYEAIKGFKDALDEKRQELDDAKNDIIDGIIDGIKDSIGIDAKDEFKVSDATVTVAEKEISAILVEYEFNEKDLEKAMKESLEAVLVALSAAGGTGNTPNKADIDSIIESSLNGIPEMDLKIEYYLAKNSGALIKISSECTLETAVENERTEFSFDMNFGARPNKKFMPEFSLTASSGNEKIELKGTSAIENKKFVFTVDGKYNDDSAGLRFEIGKDGNYVLTIDNADDKELEVTGKLAAKKDKIEFTADVSELFDDDIGLTEIAVNYEKGAEVPSAPEYKDVLAYSKDELAKIIQKLQGYGGYYG